MATYFTKFSVVVPLPNKQAKQYALDLAAQVEAIKLENDPASRIEMENIPKV